MFSKSSTPDPDRPHEPGLPPEVQIYPAAEIEEGPGVGADEPVEMTAPIPTPAGRSARRVAPARIGLILVAILAGGGLFVGGAK